MIRPTPADTLKVAGLTVLFAALLSVDYEALALAGIVVESPLQVIIVAFLDTLVLSYFTVSSRWTGSKEWATLFTVLYGMVYVLTSIETVYLGSLLSASTVLSLLVNGAISSAIFAAALIWTYGGKKVRFTSLARLQMPLREWAWKIAVSAGVYLILFIGFGALVYAPLGKALDSVAFAQEQAAAASMAVLVFPTELLRGALWTVLAACAAIALPFGWKKTGVVVGLIMAVPLSLSQFLSTAESMGLQLAHTGEIFGENMVFGLVLVWILHAHSRLSTYDEQGERIRTVGDLP